MKGKVDNLKIIVRNFNITFSIMVRTSKLKLNKVTEDLNTIKQLNLIGTYRTFYPAEYKFLSRAHETFSRIYIINYAMKQVSMYLKELKS